MVKDLPQTGIAAYAGASSDGLLTAAVYTAWYEFIQAPNYKQPAVPYTNFPVGPNDAIIATLFTESHGTGQPYPGSYVTMQLLNPQPAGGGPGTAD